MNSSYASNYDSSFVLEQLAREFQGRGLARVNTCTSQSNERTSSRTINSAHAQGGVSRSGAIPRHMQRSDSPMTLGDFERNFYSRSNYRPPVSTYGSSQTDYASARGQLTTRPAAKRAPLQQQRTVVNTKPTQPITRRAVAAVKNTHTAAGVGTIVRSFRRLPVATLLTVVACAVSLMFIVGSSVMLNEASNDYLDMQNEVSQLADQASKLSIELEEKNDLRKIETIAVNKLGMVKKDLIKREYVNIGEGDVIENYETPDGKNIGIANLLSAIGLGD